MKQSFRCAAAAILAALPTAVLAQAPTTTVWFAEGQGDVSDKLAILCADRNAMVLEQDERHVVCSRPVTGALGIFVGGQSQMMIRFALLKDKGATRVLASQWIDTPTRSGQPRRTELNGRKQTDELANSLIAAGGHNVPPDALGGEVAPQ